MKSCFHYLLFLLPALLFNSCSNEIQVLADYEENAAIYALLDPSKPIQFVKINKVFTNPSSKAVDVAKIADSIFFDTLTPMLVELDNGTVRRSIPLYRANIVLKDSGTFASSPNYLYVTKNATLSSLYDYRLELVLPKTKKLITAQTNIVRQSSVFNPVSLSNRFLAILPTSTIPVQFLTGANGKIFDAYFNFNYEEVDRGDTSIKQAKTIRWKILRSYRTVNDKNPENVIQRIQGLSFYNLLINEIPVNPNVYRLFKTCSFEFIGGNLELDNYIEASTPSIGIVQKQTEYTNIQNGIGLFASRNTLLLDNIQLTFATKNTIISDNTYKPLGFQF